MFFLASNWVTSCPLVLPWLVWRVCWGDCFPAPAHWPAAGKWAVLGRKVQRSYSSPQWWRRLESFTLKQRANKFLPDINCAFIQVPEAVLCGDPESAANTTTVRGEAPAGVTSNGTRVRISPVSESMITGLKIRQYYQIHVSMQHH